MAGWQYQLLPNIYSTLRANVGLYDFYDVEELKYITANANMLSGYAATIGLESILGPLEFSIQYSDQTKEFSGYINISYHF